MGVQILVHNGDGGLALFLAFVLPLDRLEFKLCKRGVMKVSQVKITLSEVSKLQKICVLDSYIKTVLVKALCRRGSGSLLYADMLAIISSKFHVEDTRCTPCSCREDSLDEF